MFKRQTQSPVTFHSIITEKAEIPFTIRRSVKARRVRILVTAKKIEVVATKRAREPEILKFVETKKSWILSKSEELKNLYSKFEDVSCKKIASGSAILFRGNRTLINLVRGDVRLSEVHYDGHFIITVPRELNEVDAEQSARIALKLWLKNRVRNDALVYAKQYSEIVGKKFSSVRIKQHKRIWGSCTSKGVININWQLIAAPQDVLEYVVLHEICHLVHKNHSKKFWNLVAEIMPDYKEKKQWLYGAPPDFINL